MAKEIMLYVYNKILFIYKENCNYEIHIRMDGTGKNVILSKPRKTTPACVHSYQVLDLNVRFERLIWNICRSLEARKGKIRKDHRGRKGIRTHMIQKKEKGIVE